jgi:hypothetical protein
MTPRIITIRFTTYQPSSNIVPSNRYVTCKPIIHSCHYSCCMSFEVLAASNLDITSQACCMTDLRILTEIDSQSAIVCISNLVYSQCRYCISSTSSSPYILRLSTQRYAVLLYFRSNYTGAVENFGPIGTSFCAHTNSKSWTSPSWLARWEPFNWVQPITVEESTIHS